MTDNPVINDDLLDALMRQAAYLYSQIRPLKEELNPYEIHLENIQRQISERINVLNGDR